MYYKTNFSLMTHFNNSYNFSKAQIIRHKLKKYLTSRKKSLESVWMDLTLRISSGTFNIACCLARD